MTTINFGLDCVRCGVSLQGAALDGSCPRCGLAVSSTLHLPAIDPATMTVCQDVPCRQCEYDLRTLAVGSVCPECGSPVAPSLVPVALIFADPRWLREQFRLVTITLIGLLMLLLPGFLALSLPILGQPALIGMLVIVVLVFAIPTMIMGTWALCWYQSSDPCPRHIRLLSTSYPVLLVAALFLLFVTPMLSVLGSATGTVGGIVSGGVMLCCMAGLFVCNALSIRHLGWRAQSRTLCALATAWAACLAGGIVLVMAGTLLVAWEAGLPGAQGYSFLWSACEQVIGILLGVLGVAAYVLGVVVIWICRSVLFRVIKAQANRLSTNASDHGESDYQERETACR